MNASAINQTRYACALSTEPRALDAVAECCQKVLDDLQSPPDLAFLFFSIDGADQGEEIAEQTVLSLGTENVLGCTGESIVGIAQEIEDRPAATLWAARLPQAEMDLMHLSFQHTGDGPSILGWPDSVEGSWPDSACLLLLGDPFSFPADFLLERLNDSQPGIPVLGGMASGSRVPNEHCLIVGPRIYREGAVAVLLRQGPTVRPVVSQGCRPIGKPFVVTKAHRNVLVQLGGKSALEQLNSVFAELPTSDQQLAREGLHVGRVVSEYLERFEPGDFLVRNVVGVDPDQGAIAVGDYFRVGQTVQFHVRDWQTADADIRQLLADAKDAGSPPPASALLFTCNGRGTRLFPEPHHDADALRAAFGEIPVAGFFAQGELGPVAGQNFVHGFTASVALFYE